MDISTILGLLMGFGMIVLGFILEHGQLSSLFLVSPAVIVFGGTLGAVMVSFSLREVLSIPKLIISACKLTKFEPAAIIKQMVGFSEISRKEGLLSLEKHLNKTGKDKLDPFLERGLALVVDGTNVDTMRELLETDIIVSESKTKIDASIFEAAGGFSPTLGIIGTVMGLIQVLSNMGEPEELTKSIAVAFIATLYGVCFANVLFLPLANKIKLKAKYERMNKELIIEALCSILNGETPRMLADRLAAYGELGSKGKKAEK